MITHIILLKAWKQDRKVFLIQQIIIKHISLFQEFENVYIFFLKINICPINLRKYKFINL